MKPYITVALALGSLLAGTLPGEAQKLVTRDFRELKNDQSATLFGQEVKDQNGRTASLLKIYTPFPITDLSFGGTLLGVVKTVQHAPGEVWVYLPKGSAKLTVGHARYGYTDLSYESVGLLESGRTYSVSLNVEGRPVAFVASAPDAEIEIDGLYQKGKTPFNVFVPYGTHRVKASVGSLLYDDVVTVSPDGPDRFMLQLEDENKKYGEVTMKVPDGVQIYFQNELGGVGEYTARLREGQYSVETRKKDHEPQVSAFTVVPGERQTVYPAPPVPHRGFLEISTEPSTGVTVWSGDTVFTTQRLVQLPVGKYELTFRKSGYDPLTRTVDVVRDATVTEEAVLERTQYVKANSLWAGVGFVATPQTGLGFHIGGTYRNVELEGHYTLGLKRSDEVNWYSDTDNVLAGVSDYRSDRFGVTAGYRLRFAGRFGLTPRLGWEYQYLSASKDNPGRNYSLSSLTLGVKALYMPVPLFGVFVTPSFGIPLTDKGDIKEVCRLGGITRGGFSLEAGIQLGF